MSETEDDDDEERDAPTAVGKVSERLLKALKERNATDAKVVSSVPTPPVEPTEDEDESATNVLIEARAIPVRRAPAPAPAPAESDEDKSETLYAITTQTGRTPAAPPAKEAPPPPAEVPGSDGPIVAPLASPSSGLKFWAVPAIIAACILALAAWVLLNHG